MSTTIYADSWTGSAATGKITQRAYMTYTINQTATTYQIIVQSGVQQWNPTWTKIKTVCTLTDQSDVTKTLTQSSGANHLHQFFNVTYTTINKTSSTQSKTITGTSKITGGVDSAHGSGTVLNKTSTVSHVFNIPAELKVSGSTLISKTFSTSEQTATLAATGGTSPYTFTELGEQGDTNYFSISGSTLKIAANTPVGNYAYRVKVKDADEVSISVDYNIRISKANISPTVSMANWTYGGTASTPSVSGNSGNGTVTYHYKVSTAADSTYTTTKPSNAGTYTVRASIAATTNYNAGTATKNFTISKATPTLSVTGATLTYSGSAQTLVSSASVTGGGTIYYGLGSSSTSAPGSWSTTKPTATNIGTYYIWAKADASTNYSAVAAVYKAAATIKAGTYTITLNANGGSGGTASVQITYGTTKGNYPSITRPTKTGYTFTGFYSATSGGTQWYDANGNSVRTFDLLANTTWYAQWSINSYTLTIDPNGGSWGGTTAVSTAPQNYNTTKSIAAPTRNGYVFVGWAETGPGHLSKINNTDPSFDSSNGGVGVYNNSGGGTVTHTRQSSSAGTAYGSYEILINASSGTTSPGNGGFYQNTQSAANQKYIHVFVAKIPAGYTVQQACNATGNGRTIQWLTSRKGMGGYQVYAYQHNCGSDGTFSTFGHVYLDTGNRPVSWQLAYSAMTNITNGFADTYTYGAGAGRLTALWSPIVPMHANINGTWKTGPVWLNINGTWKQAIEGYVNINGTWKQIK